MIFKIIITIPIISFGFYLFSLAIKHGDISNPNQTRESKKYEDLTGIISFVAIFLLISNIWNGNTALYSYCKLDEDAYNDLMTSIDILYDDFPKDAYSTLYCYFEDEDVTFRDAQKAFSDIQSYLEENHSILNDIYNTLEDNYIEAKE